MKTCAGRMFFIVSGAGLGPMGLFLPLEECFSFFQQTRKKKPVLEGCFSSFQRPVRAEHPRRCFFFNPASLLFNQLTSGNTELICRFQRFPNLRSADFPIKRT